MNVIETTALDQLSYLLVKQDTEALQALEALEVDEVAMWPALIEDLWTSLFRKEVTLVKDVPPFAEINRHVMRAMLDLSEWRELRLNTIANNQEATMATLILGEHLLQIIAECEEKDEDGVRLLLRGVLQGVGEELEESNEALAMIGLEGDSGKRFDADTKLKMAKTLKETANFKKLAEMVGRMKAAAGACRQSFIEPSVSEVVDVTLGCDLAHILPSELVYLAEPETEILFFRNFVEGRLLQYKLRDREPRKQGPIVLCFDASKSMASGHRSEWTKGVVLALAAVCRREKRDLNVIGFSKTVRQVWSFPKGAVEPSDFVDLSAFPCKAGTSFEAPLAKAFMLIEERRAENADVILITDGHAEISSKFAEAARKSKDIYGFRVFGIVMDDGKRDQLDKVCDDVAMVARVGKDADAFDIIFGAAWKRKF